MLNGFDQVMIEPSVRCPPPIIRLPPPRQGDEDGLWTRCAPNALGGLVAVQPRKADVEQDDVRLEFCNRSHGVCSIVRRPDFMTDELEQHGDHVRRVLIVIDDQDALGLRFDAGGWRLERSRDACGRRGERRQSNGDFRPAARSFALDGKLAIVTLHQALGERQSDAETALALDRRCGLGEHLEHAWQIGGVDPYPRVSDPNHRICAVAIEDEHHRPTSRCELRGVGQNVADHLRQACGIGFDVDR